MTKSNSVEVHLFPAHVKLFCCFEGVIRSLEQLNSS